MALPGLILPGGIVSAKPKVYTTWNPSDKTAGTTLSGGNLIATDDTATYNNVRSVQGMSSGAWYWEVTLGSANASACGIAKSTSTLSTNLGADANGWGYYTTGAFNNNGSTLLTLSTYTSGAVIGFAFDATNGRLWISKNGTWQNGGTTPSTSSSTGAVATGLTSGPYYADVGNGSSVTTTWTANFGASAFSGAVPSGFNSGVYT